MKNIILFTPETFGSVLGRVFHSATQKHAGQWTLQ